MKRNPKIQFRGYTLIETLVATAVMMVAVAAASSLSLSMVTQEEISERTVRVMNHLENAASLYQLGLNEAEIKAILPTESAIKDLKFNADSASVTDLGAINFMEMEVEFYPSAASEVNKTDEISWTGGVKDGERKHTVSVFRSLP